MNHNPVVITPLESRMALDIARPLGKRGIKVYAVDPDDNPPGKHSKYIQHIQCPDPADGPVKIAEYIQFLVDFSNSLGVKPVLYPLNDNAVLIISENRDLLKNYYEFVMPDHATTHDLVTKDGLISLAEKANIPSPQTFFVGNREEVEEIVKKIIFPAIIKPTESMSWHARQIKQVLQRGMIGGLAKVIYCEDEKAFWEAYDLIAPLDPNMVVQEVIPGEDDQLVYMSFYLDRQSQPLGIFAGRKIRIMPTGFGSASYVHSMVDPELENLTLHFLKVTGYQGLGGIEFKKDPRDGCYKLIEFNARFGLWDGLSVRCGVDLPYISYCDTLGIPVEPQLKYREGVIWADLQRDIRAMLEYRRNGKITVRDWLRSFRGERMFSVYSWEDWKPGVYYTLEMISKLLNKVGHQ